MHPYHNPAVQYAQERDLESCQYLDANKTLLRRHVETTLQELDLCAAFKEKLGNARKAPNKHLQSCRAQGKAVQQMTAYATLKQLESSYKLSSK